MNLKTAFVAVATALAFASCDTRDDSVIKAEEQEHARIKAQALQQGQAAADYFKAQYDSVITMDPGHISTVQRAIPAINEKMAAKFNTVWVKVSGRLAVDKETKKLETAVTTTDIIGRRIEYVNAVKQ